MRAFLSAFVFLTLRSGVALAQDAGVALAVPTVSVPKPSAVTSITESIIQIMGAALAAALVLLVKVAITYIQQKTKIEIPQKTEQTLEEWAVKAANYAREKAHQYNQTNPAKMSGPAKMETALNFGLDLAAQYKLDTLAKEKLVRAIEAHLGSERQS